MGSITAHPLQNIKQKYDIKCFIETGTWKGLGVTAAQKIDFKQIMSVDISTKHLEENLKKFENDRRVLLFTGDSGIRLKNMLECVTEGNVLFWLDAHLPDLNGKENELNQNVITPLERELELLKDYRNIAYDVFIIDDLRLYEYIDIPGFGNCFDSNFKGNTKFVNRILGDTHIIKKEFRDQGYITCFPKGDN